MNSQEFRDALINIMQPKDGNKDGWFTVSDLAKITNWSTRRVRYALRELGGGRLEVGRKSAKSIDGRVTRVPCYRITGEASAEAEDG